MPLEEERTERWWAEGRVKTEVETGVKLPPQVTSGPLETGGGKKDPPLETSEGVRRCRHLDFGLPASRL